MSTIQTAYAVLQQEGYKPTLGEEGTLSFRYFGQSATFKGRTVGPVTVAELECSLPRPAPSASVAQAFIEQHPLSRLSSRGGQTVLTLETMLTSREVEVQLLSLLQLLDQYAADVVFGVGPQVVESQVAAPPHAQAASTPAPLTTPESTLPQLSQTSEAPQTARPEPPAPHEIPHARASELSPGWQETLGLMHERFHPLARALAGLGAPLPDEVQMDMMQGHQVKGTAIMLWGKPPSAVVVCEPGQMIPSGYQGGTWLKHQTPEQIAQETLAFLKAARLA